jgi:uncharacterized phage-associated protein
MTYPRPHRVRSLRKEKGGDKSMASVRDVAAYILRERGPMTAMKLQKLCYYAYGYHLAWEERPLFAERFQAWANGPVCPDLYACHRGRFELKAGDIAGDPTVLDEGERESVDLVLAAYAELTAHQLSAMTHREPPWVCARSRARVEPMERSHEVLSDAEIYEFFDAATAGDGEEG